MDKLKFIAEAISIVGLLFRFVLDAVKAIEEIIDTPQTGEQKKAFLLETVGKIIDAVNSAVPNAIKPETKAIVLNAISFIVDAFVKIMNALGLFRTTSKA